MGIIFYTKKILESISIILFLFIPIFACIVLEFHKIKQFAGIINFLASILLSVGVSDYTNGYRVYSRRSINLITSQCGNIGDGFIVLSEILLTINLKKFKIDELLTVFINRKRGESSVNLKLIIQSLLGLFKLYIIKKLKK